MANPMPLVEPVTTADLKQNIIEASLLLYPIVQSEALALSRNLPTILNPSSVAPCTSWRSTIARMRSLRMSRGS